MNLEYRPEIDGLRAIAVLPVILFHAGFSTFSGGFVGVDVFFVISGYLITSIIVKDVEAGTFSFWDFYERRARRILPALFLVMLCCIPFAWMWMLPTELKAFSASVVAVGLFASNFLFWRQSGYFDAAAEMKPLLHTWSLSVEEQFYIFFPIAILLLWRLGRRNVVGSILLVTLLSLALSEYASRYYPSANFYLLPTRAWELLAGALCSFIVAKPHIPRDNVLSLAGLVAITMSIFIYDEDIPFPSLYALLPVLGTCAVLQFARQGTLVASLLSLKPVVGMGLISYSAYLWHQPLFAFAHIRSLTEPTWQLMLFLAVASTAFAYLSWRFIEVPARRRGEWPLPSRRTVFATLGVVAVAFITTGLVGHFSKGFPSRLTNISLNLVDYDYRPYFREGTCFLRPEQTYKEFGQNCIPISDINTTLIWGDSHAAALSFGLRKTLMNVFQLTASGCPPIKDEVYDDRPNCHNINEFIAGMLNTANVSRLIIHANWERYPDFFNGLEDTIKYIKKVSPNTEIIVIGGVPQWMPDLPTFVWMRDITPDRSLKAFNPTLEQIRRIDLKLRSIADQQEVLFFSMTDHLCDGTLCQVTAPSAEGWDLISFDYGHSTGAGSLYMAKLLADEIH